MTDLDWSQLCRYQRGMDLDRNPHCKCAGCKDLREDES